MATKKKITVDKVEYDLSDYIWKHRHDIIQLIERKLTDSVAHLGRFRNAVEGIKRVGGDVVQLPKEVRWDADDRPSILRRVTTFLPHVMNYDGQNVEIVSERSLSLNINQNESAMYFDMNWPLGAACAIPISMTVAVTPTPDLEQEMPSAILELNESLKYKMRIGNLTVEEGFISSITPIGERRTVDFKVFGDKVTTKSNLMYVEISQVDARTSGKYYPYNITWSIRMAYYAENPLDVDVAMPF